MRRPDQDRYNRGRPSRVLITDGWIPPFPNGPGGPDGRDESDRNDRPAYRYAVSGYDYSGEVAATTGTDKQAPSAPASLTATAEDWGTALTWSHAADADLDEYTVWRGTTVDGVCTDAEKIWYTAVAKTSYQDVNVADGMAPLHCRSW
ncbi:hypothetical protein ACKI1I_01240 [Streptomyces turgidiscabies]|uniref:hypothetical protein n=1 Tax=Streptomyces TaxID=1883 RepID=UPI00031A46B4|nr:MULTISPECIES: hypothetical protein [Streptomyces]MDX3492477.1 hypothetical protein [Streptomyces turgidiscabies]GAQ69229.1 hypothetical protein T45_00951 [Streptomyces turgidiscabies]